MHRNFLTASLECITSEEAQHLDDYISFCLLRKLTIKYLSTCYSTIVEDTMREQIYFQKHHHYRYSSFAEVSGHVYFNDEYMSHYMYGLALTSFLWPNHLALFRFFKSTLPKNMSGKYLEIGPGHGYFFMTAMALSSYQRFLGVDISDTSIAMTKDLLDHFWKDKQKKFELQCLDFLAADLLSEKFDAIVMGEVLEHVEHPELFLQKIYRIAKKDTHIFVTTCINAPAIDHIYLFKNQEQIECLFKDCGFRIKKELIRPYEGKTLQESQQQSLAVNVAYVLEKQ